MPSDIQKIQVGIRLPADLVRQIDAARQHNTRAEYCRQLIEAGMAATAPDAVQIEGSLARALQPIYQQLSELRQAAVLAERDSGKSVAQIKSLRNDLATAIVGVLVKIGQVVQEKDQRRFAREKAEQFVKRTLLDHAADGEAI
jgi:metal-responsive CopG/Arc/MetJ family transcriptional regulator